MSIKHSLQGPPKFTKIGIFSLAIYRLATLPSIVLFVLGQGEFGESKKKKI
jgi:hypothetical protein